MLDLGGHGRSCFSFYQRGMLAVHVTSGFPAIPLDFKTKVQQVKEPVTRPPRFPPMEAETP